MNPSSHPKSELVFYNPASVMTRTIKDSGNCPFAILSGLTPLYDKTLRGKKASLFVTVGIARMTPRWRKQWEYALWPFTEGEEKR